MGKPIQWVPRKAPAGSSNGNWRLRLAYIDDDYVNSHFVSCLMNRHRFLISRLLGRVRRRVVEVSLRVRLGKLAATRMNRVWGLEKPLNPSEDKHISHSL